MADAPANVAGTIGALEATTKKNEQELVIEFATDRILMYIGVYLVAFIGTVAKISELAGSSLTCYPAPSGNTSVSSDFIKYANTYCWESSNVTISSNSSCDDEEYADTRVINDPTRFKTIFRALPYVLLLEALLYALPSMFWHSRAGAKLMGHMKFMRNLLVNIYEEVKLIPTVEYDGEIYDQKSYYLNGWNGFEPRGEGNGNAASTELSSVRGQTGSNVENHESQSLVNKSDSQEPNRKYLERCLFGDRTDRHLFSMLCFENFSSLEHHPHILSVYKLTSYPQDDEEDRQPMIKGMLSLFCQEKNFGGTFLVATYFIRHAIGAAVSLIAIVVMAVLLSCLANDGFSAESFKCDIPYHGNLCVSCTVIRRLDMIAYLIVNLGISLLYFAISTGRIIFLRSKADRAIYHYFDEISDTGSVALYAAALVKSMAKKQD